MTPISLVQDMLDTLPKEVWSNPKLKFLDPCNGCGIFSSVIVNRLMYGLKEFEPDEELRYKHIVENQLYVGELQAKNMFLFLCAFDPNDEYSLNIYNGSFLDEKFDEHTREIWGIEKFDVIVMNPPYQELKEGNKKSQPLWDKFVKKSIESCLVEAGYFVGVHPSNWRDFDGGFKTIQTLLRSKKILSLNLHNREDGVKMFGVQTTFDFYCIKNSPSNNTITTIKCQDGIIEKLDISNMEFIPNGMFNEIQKLIAKEGEEKVEVLYSRSAYGSDKKHMSKEKTEDFKYPCVYTILKDGTVNLFWSLSKNGHFNTPKVIWSNGISKPIIDKTGEYGLTQFAYAIVDEPINFENIQKSMLNEKFIKLMSFCDGTMGHRYKRKVISTFRKDFWKEFLD